MRTRGDPMKLGMRQGVVSAGVFGLIVLALAWTDDRVRDVVVSQAGGASSWGSRAGDVGGVVVSAVRHQSIENAPMVVFAVVGAVLVLLMVRT
jgi:hypothetical protein